MKAFSSGSATLAPEFGVLSGRWAQYAESGDLPELPFDAMWVVVPPGGRTNEDCHPELELSVVVEGSATFESPNGRTDASAGTTVLMDSAERHVIYNKSTESRVVILSVYWMPQNTTEAADGE
ncbi:MAG TPA: cupin domain-containing protein [Mycobacteriales bacterium]|jgi:Cupin domain.